MERYKKYGRGLWSDLKREMILAVGISDRKEGLEVRNGEDRQENITITKAT